MHASRSRTAGSVALLVSLLLAANACSSNDNKSAGSGAAPPLPKVSMLKSLGTVEGELNLVNWAGYAEDGTNDKTVDWVHPFEKATGCTVHSKIGNTSDEMVALMKTGQYDGVSASGDATLRLIYGGLVAPVNTDLVPNYATIQDFLKNRSWNSVDGKSYGTPHGWGANLLMWNTAVVKQKPTSWGVVFDANSPYKGKVTAYDSPIYIADAALYLMKHQPDLGIKNPYALDRKQLDAAVKLLKQQKPNVGEYWSDYTKAVQAFESGNSVIGTTWQVIANLVTSDKKASVQTIVPSEGSTGWSDTWMVAAKAKHPNCMYKWMDWITSPKVNAQVAEWFGEAPAQSKACDETADKAFCTTYHAADKAYSEKISYWTTPTKHCLDGRGNICTDYATWTQEWTGVKG
ncbi:MAG: ABC transporter substrate-binding protein [Actinomycetota bacterium]|nr:ABC transporter substrate-binding protein [Actinomycetota bacterium]